MCDGTQIAHYWESFVANYFRFVAETISKINTSLSDADRKTLLHVSSVWRCLCFRVILGKVDPHQVNPTIVMAKEYAKYAMLPQNIHCVWNSLDRKNPTNFHYQLREEIKFIIQEERYMMRVMVFQRNPQKKIMHDKKSHKNRDPVVALVRIWRKN